ncbi:indole-3-glycerol phosphate synthase TrpC [Blattabacterium cuenoti]|uniref:indole-3-glycerol phosphate synthase TrpC n=1 Tax=Blattabacterium cuenoti TaxID=1653831 RepID=UPI00163C2033|nr:indole-3-glycerol phosphate synthase TrpC [Blattabacterium cuenoti]
MNFLDQIILKKKKEVSKNKEFFSIKKLESSSLFQKKTSSIVKNLRKNNIGIIAEFKRKSPSKGMLNKDVFIEKVVKDYEKAGAIGLSILTDFSFFSGRKEDLIKTCSIVTIPVLRKDFIIDEYQIIESKSIGSDVILLIADILSKKKIRDFSFLAKSIGLEIILELNREKEMDKLTDHIDIIGINNRNLHNFIVDSKNCLKLISKLPNNYLKIAESGINNIQDILYLKNRGFSGFLIGEFFMKTKDPGNTCKNMIETLKNYEK